MYQLKTVQTTSAPRKATMKTTKLPKPKKIKKSTLRNKADRLFSYFVRSKNVCELSGLDHINCGGSLQCMHILTRGRTALRYNIMNVLCGCSGHHVYYTYHPMEWQKLIMEHFYKKWNYVQDHQNDTITKTEDLYREVIETYGKSK